MVALVAAAAYFLFGVYDKNDTMQENLPLGVVIIVLVGIFAVTFHFLDKAFRRSLK
jgi:hypothetical protein